MIAHNGQAHVCYTTTNGRDRHYLGCAHKTPREAIRHEAPVFVNPIRLPGEPVIPAGDGRYVPVGGLTEASDSIDPLPVPLD